MFVTLPLFICLAVKIYFGIRWCKLMTLPALCSFYLISWTFYTSFVLTESLILIVAWHTFTDLYITIVIIAGVLCFMAWFFLYYHVTYEDQVNRTMNDYRKQAMLIKQNRANRKEEDRRLLEAHKKAS